MYSSFAFSAHCILCFSSLAKSVLLTSHKNKRQYNIREGNIVYEIIHVTKKSVEYLITKQYAIWEEISTLDFQQVIIFSKKKNKITIEIDIHLMALWIDINGRILFSTITKTS